MLDKKIYLGIQNEIFREMLGQSGDSNKTAQRVCSSLDNPWEQEAS
jgi:hypothetical protein